jgi:cation:H+ antiporter
MVGNLIATGAPLGLSAGVFLVGAAASLAASAVLVAALERVGERLRLTELALGLVAALAANAPEITSATTALARNQHAVGVGVVLGSNVFNLAALLGLSALIAGRIALHRRVLVLAGVVALALSLVALATVAGLAPAIGLALGVVVFAPYVVLSALTPPSLRHLPLPARAVDWLVRAIAEEEEELRPAIHPAPGDLGDAVRAGAALVVVVVASIAMERSATSIGARLGVSEIVIGAVVLAAVTSLPNAVASVYLSRRNRGPAVLSEALNSNNLNVVLGLLVPGVILGLGTVDPAVTGVALWYLGLTAVAVLLAYGARGLGRVQGAVVVFGYLAFVVAVVMR